MNLSKILILIVLACIGTSLDAQNPKAVIQSKVVLNIAGNDYYIHQIEQGQTLYSIAKAYGVSVDDIRQINPGLGDRLITGQKIKIPKNVGNSSINAGQQQESVTEVQTPQTFKKNYFEYQARSKESLYAVAVHFRVSIDDIYALNPGIGDQLKKEQIIKIPASNIEASYITHKVKSKLSLNRLAKDYKINVDEIREINPYISRNLDPGQVIKIPLKKIETDETNQFVDTLSSNAIKENTEPAEEVPEKELCQNMMVNGECRVALMLPFYFSEIDTLRKSITGISTTVNSNPVNPKSFNFIQFYEGFMLALDSLKQLGLNAKVYVYNVEENTTSAQQIIRNPELKTMDLIIGPVYARSFGIVAGFARENHIFIVNPFSTREEIILDNPYVFKVVPSINWQFPDLVSYLNDHYRYAQIFVARNNLSQNAGQYEALETEMKKNLTVREFPLTDLFTEIIYNRDSLHVFRRKASTDRQNVIVIYSDNKAFLLDFMRKYSAFKDRYPITIFGLPNWKKIEGLDLGNMNNLNTHILAEDFVDYRLPVVKKLVNQYRDIYKTEPQKYAFDGYNIGIYFMSALMKFGSHFGDCIRYFDMDLLNTGYNFESQPGQGFENTYWNVLKMSDKSLIDASKKLPTYNFSRPPGKYYKYKD